MSGRIVGAFVLGLAVGVAGLAGVMWQTGMFRRAVIVGAPVGARSPQVAPVPETLPDMEAGKRYQSPSVPVEPVWPPPQPQKSPVPETLGNASRTVPDAPPSEATPSELVARHLLIPVQGVEASQLSDTFSDKRSQGAHEALDIMAPKGTSVVAADEGNVVKLFTSKRGGLTVYQFDNSRQWCYYYAHLDRYAPGLREGMLLRRGDTLGYVGSTGDADPSAPHLHFAIFRLGPEKRWWEGTAVNPLPLFRRP